MYGYLCNVFSRFLKDLKKNLVNIKITKSINSTKSKYFENFIIIKEC